MVEPRGLDSPKHFASLVQGVPPPKGVRVLHSMLKMACPSGTDHLQCGAKGTRTPNPLLAKQVRYQLRHGPVIVLVRGQTLSLAAAHVSVGLSCLDFDSAQKTPAAASPRAMIFFMEPPVRVGVRGLEPRTSSLSGMRSNQAELYARNSGELYRTALPSPKTGRGLSVLR